MMPRYKVLVTPRFFDEATADYLEEHGCDVRIAESPGGKGDADLSEEDLMAHLAEVDGWIVGQAWVSRALLAANPRLKVIARRGVGYERVDVAAARELGRVVTIAAGGNAPSVADLTIGLMLGAGRHIGESNRRMRSGKWAILVGTELYRKTVGVVGLGQIGRQVVQRLRGFETRILAFAPRPDPDFVRANEIVATDIETVFSQSDYITLHLPLRPETTNLIDKVALASMKRGAILINTSRAGLVDEAALLEALVSGHLGGAGLDVMQAETDPAAQPLADRILALPNVVATPHAGASTREGLPRANMVAARTVIAVLEDRDPDAGCVVADGRVRRLS